MRYTNTIDLWADGITAAILSGNLKLQPGQWVRCGKGGTAARFVGVRSAGSIWVAHSEGSGGTSRSFPRLMSAMYGAVHNRSRNT